MGTITSMPAGINCGTTCSASFVDGTVVTLTAMADPSSDFTGWVGGSCSGTGTCVVTMTAAANIRANFTLKTYALTVTTSGGGSVTSNPAGINCGTACTSAFDHGSIVTLTPAPGTGTMFSSWGGACTGSGACMVTMTQAASVSATFVPQVVGISVIKIGTGTGTVTSSPAGINCGATCNASYAIGAMVTLTAASDTTSDFQGWSGACTGTGTCVISVAGATTVTANFTLKQYPLNVTVNGTGSGLVTSNPVGINCGPSGPQCNKSYEHGTLVTLSVMSAPGSVFAGWMGACTGSGACVVTMDQARNVIANFNLQNFALQITKSGLGSGTVASVPPGAINCGADCSEIYPYNTVVTLNPNPAANATFVGWSGGGCTGTGACVVTMNQAQTVNAKYDPIQLNVAFTGNGFGVVNSSPVGINNCSATGGTCSASFNAGTTVQLTATAENSIQSRLSNFVGWTGACSGNGTCVVTMASIHNVAAQFVLRPNLAFVTSTTTNAAFGGVAGGDTICANAATASGLGGTYRALLTTSSVTAQSRISGASGWMRVDGKPLATDASDITSGVLFSPLRISNTGADVGEGAVWTASINLATTCMEFTTTSGSATTGRSSGLGGIFMGIGGSGCSALNRLYCFGIDRLATVSLIPAPPPRRNAFVTNNWVPSGGLPAADAVCQAQATSAGLPGTYLALLATTTASASSRFSFSGAPWARVDGILLSPAAMSFFTSTYWDMAPNMNAAGTQTFGNLGTWTGSTSPTTAGTMASTCNNWTTTAATGTGGRIGYTHMPSYFGFDVGLSCTQMFYGLTCLQQ